MYSRSPLNFDNTLCLWMFIVLSLFKFDIKRISVLFGLNWMKVSSLKDSNNQN